MGGSNSPITKFVNVSILRNRKVIREELWVQDGKIIDPEKMFWQRKEADITVDGHGLLIAPGYIDLQINGAYGFDFSSPSDLTERNGVQEVAKRILSTGCTAFAATVITSEPATYAAVLPHLSPRPGGRHGATVLGAHVEGPFINEQKYGAHKKEFVKSRCHDFDELCRTYGCLDNIRVITVAPEIPGMLPCIPQLVSRGIVVSCGHSMASLGEGIKAVEQGATLITHLFNAMVPFHHRDPGLVGLLGTRDNKCFYSIIVDGVHSHAASVNIAYKSHPEGLVLITDAIEAMGLGPGSYELGTMHVDICDNQAFISGTRTLAGSIATLDGCVRNFRDDTGCSVVEAIEAATLHPAQTLGIQKSKGTLDFGSDADFIFLDAGLFVKATYIGGVLAWKADDL
eukprot:TRINITY_DN2741_c0_g1_i4.p1 TRINITY_DN2741_c0_g1~~TRINITY_DN2741_c0_g1_i4.p1  ORF type:complete len:399 (+),score=-12.59 TRINITY_DN2741_c0_g1_i4:70-1266(+)